MYRRPNHCHQRMRLSSHRRRGREGAGIDRIIAISMGLTLGSRSGKCAARRGLFTVVILPLVACTSTTRLEPPASAPTDLTPSPGSAPAPRAGGYYKDDGPGEHPPANLDALPDAVPKLEALNRFANRPYSVFGVY